MRIHGDAVGGNELARSLAFFLGAEAATCRTGAAWPEIARAYLIARDAFGLGPMWEKVQALDLEVPAATQISAEPEGGTASANSRFV